MTAHVQHETPFIPGNLRTIRLALGYTHQRMAHWMGVKLQAFMSYEYGAAVMKYSLVRKLSEMTGIPKSDILDVDMQNAYDIGKYIKTP